MRLLGVAVVIAVALAAPLNALSLPSNGKLSFDAMRKGKDIGDHSYSFSGTESVKTKRGAVLAHHYQLSGGLARDLWYDYNGNLAQVAL